MIETVRDPLKKEFNLTDAYIDQQNFHNLYHITDTAVSLDFEGYPEHKTYYTDD